ncbi:hypothetical protein F8M41_024789 [Gigaspora margarita]|uniref:Uncharacterized protein n=1 Tax=Gigaspora margarita TaxID=4874 RepID=A0A8H3XJM3_GIGMA|nr:hypothetical protein F8M41_024789 [Gigaspora margarita]
MDLAKTKDTPKVGDCNRNKVRIKANKNKTTNHYQNEIEAKPDIKKIMSQDQKLANLGNDKVIYHVGYCYPYGIRVKKDENNRYRKVYETWEK